MKNQNTMNIEFTQAEQNLMNQLTLPTAAETIAGIKMTSKEVALYEFALGAASIGLWTNVKIAKSALAKLNPKAESYFFGNETSEQPAGVGYKTFTPSYAPATSTKVGRNTPCPCGSGKKSKKCCK